ncbi:hypothetical protein G7046_g3974 [Stylonectria norvegica]|nr:hypothetical protein G7046_g3974 [Stylonectria norvegica]
MPRYLRGPERMQQTPRSPLGGFASKSREPATGVGRDVSAVIMGSRAGPAREEMRNALREIDRLKQCLKDLQNEKFDCRTQNPCHLRTPDQSSDSPGSASSHQPPSTNDLSSQNSSLSPFSLTSGLRPQWVGIHVATARSDQASYYGPASSFYFMSRIGGFLGKALQTPFADRSFQPRGANRHMHLGCTPNEGEEAFQDDASVQPTRDINGRTGPLNRAQEEAFLALFWEGYHCMQPVIDEVEFRRHFTSLWAPDGQSRKESPLTDIVLAVCLQYGYALIHKEKPQISNRDALFEDATVAGRWYYRRARALLAADLESPSITTVQCYLFIAIYLCCASFHNMCHITTATAIRTAQVLGLHLEPPADLPHGERELRKRIWWSLWSMDAKTSAKHGRPFLVDWAQMTVTLPCDDAAAAFYNSASLGSYGPNITWLTYFLSTQKLFIAMVEVHNALFVRCGEVMNRDDLDCLYADPKALESCACVLESKLVAMSNWVQSVPSGLKTIRRDGGQSLSTDNSALEIEALAPVWLQRQRICLELMYHSMMLNLTRPFITFYANLEKSAPISQRLAKICVDHAIAYTLIEHQVVSETGLMDGWTDFFSLQWSAAMTIVGFVLAYPAHPTTPQARQAVDKAILTFDTWGVAFPVSADAAAITRGLIDKADQIAERAAAKNPAIGTAQDHNTAAASTESIPDFQTVGEDEGLAWLDPSRQDDDQFSQFMDWALSVDSFNSYERFFDASNPADPWAFGREQ